MRFSCIICGDVIWRGNRDSKVSWLEEFRAVFSSPPDPLEPKVSGVGLNHDPDYGFYVVPSSYDTRWDDEGYEFPADDELPMMRQAPWDGRHGFILHAACYSLLQQFYSPRGVPVTRLWEICKSCPCQYLSLSWGHDYGGIVRLENTYPWKDQDIDIEQPELHQQQRADPWNIPELEELLQGVQLSLPKKQEVNLIKLTMTDDAALPNLFTKLPLEILGYIVTYLPTNEVRALAHTSKGLAMIIPSSLGQSFWASRFQPPFEFDFAFEAQMFRDMFEWRSLYFRLLKVMRCSPGLQNRKRIWGLIRSPLSELLCLHWKGSPALLPVPLDKNKEELRWKEVHGNLQPLERALRASGFNRGCRKFYTQRTYIPALLCQVVISIVLIGNATYITGVCFIPSEGLEVQLGYTLKGSSLSTTNQSIDITGIRGFILAIGLRGIQALQFITYTGQLSQWFGCPNDLPKTRRLITSKSITALEAGFDGFKMVSLAVAETLDPYLKGPTSEAKSLQESAIWFPDIPESHLYLNETCFTGIATPASEFRPLCYTLFRGSGVDFQYLVKILVLFQGSCIMVIDFYYNTGNIQRLGYQRHLLSAYETLEFSIDGANGERLKMIEVDLETSPNNQENAVSFWKYGRLRSFRISTNQGRQKHLRGKQDLPGQLYLLKPMVIAPGTTLTGLYVGWDHIYGLVSLGVISEFLEEL